MAYYINKKGEIFDLYTGEKIKGPEAEKIRQLYNREVKKFRWRPKRLGNIKKFRWKLKKLLIRK